MVNYRSWIGVQTNVAYEHEGSNMVYQMGRQLARGEEAERQLDAHFADRFVIIPATREQQRQGIDRVFTQRKSGKPYLIEYKTDWTAGRTNNAFIETISVDTLNIPGWAYSSTAEWLIYFVPHRKQIYIAHFAKLRESLEDWIKQYGPAKAIPNQDYHTWGVPVPLDKFVKCCSKVEQAVG